MGMALRLGLHFCLIGERVIFLDVPSDRYFCLSRALEQIFRNLVAGMPVSSEAGQQLLAAGVIVRSSQAPLPAPCPLLATTRASMLDDPHRRAGTVEIIRAYLALRTARQTLKRRGFAELLAAFVRRKNADRGRTVGRADLIANAFVHTGLFATTHDHCLVRSVAIAQRMVAAGLRPDLALGVKLEPFKAHCWVQHDGAIVNDHWDVVRDFTPVLVL